MEEAQTAQAVNVLFQLLNFKIASIDVPAKALNRGLICTANPMHERFKDVCSKCN